MTNSELAVHLNNQLGLAGLDAVTANVIRQWVAWDVLPKAKVQGRISGKGPAWSRSGLAMTRALRLGELRKFGVRREKALIVQAYIEWGHSDFARVRDALSSDWAKWTAQWARSQTTFLGNSLYGEISTTKQRAIATQLGPLDARLKGTPFEQSPELYAVITHFARMGDGHPEYVAALVVSALRHIMPGAEKLVPDGFIEAFVCSVSGVTGSPDEVSNSGASAIQAASEREFRIARYSIRPFLRLLRKAEQHAKNTDLPSVIREACQILHRFAPQISAGPWLIVPFVYALKALVPNGETSPIDL